MATSFAMQSILTSPVARTYSKSRVNQLGFPATYITYQRRNAGFRVRSMAEDEPKEETATPVTPTTPPPPQPKPVSKLKKMNNTLPQMIAGEHQVLRCASIQRAGAGEDQRAIGDDRVCGGDGGGGSERARRVRADRERRDLVVPGDEHRLDAGFAGSVVQRSERGIEIASVHVVRCRALEWKVRDVGIDRSGFHGVCEGRNTRLMNEMEVGNKCFVIMEI
ncbi:early light-induced protein, chloroplastic [Senna tora]|uniref:Early light-induced protein, chloroplastic n=1 Tax=Senna tora TaxID=362788 RepID=A0A834SQ42_9FABA|nr:early light-induced protein, chloroplastic [Senna tora]